MVAIKPSQLQTFIKNPDPRYMCFLFYGPDQGLVSERAAEVSRILADRETPQGEIIRIEDPDLENNPDRLEVELHTLPMFGGRKIVRTTLGRRINSSILKSFIGDQNLAGLLIIEAGSMRPDESLRAACEKSALAAAIGCYADEVRDLDTLVRDILKQSGNTITTPARNMLVARLGADRALSRSEIDKLCLYVGKQNEITEADINAVVGDAAEMTIERIVNATGLRDGPNALKELERALFAGENAQVIISALLRHFLKLHRILAAREKGTSIETAISELRPPIHFKQKDAFVAQTKIWNLKNLLLALEKINEAAKKAREHSALEHLQAEQVIFTLTDCTRI